MTTHWHDDEYVRDCACDEDDLLGFCTCWQPSVEPARDCGVQTHRAAARQRLLHGDPR